MKQKERRKGDTWKLERSKQEERDGRERERGRIERMKQRERDRKRWKIERM